jgi:hypothetical protein
VYKGLFNKFAFAEGLSFDGLDIGRMRKIGRKPYQTEIGEPEATIESRGARRVRNALARRLAVRIEDESRSPAERDALRSVLVMLNDILAAV